MSIMITIIQCHFVDIINATSFERNGSYKLFVVNSLKLTKTIEIFYIRKLMNIPNDYEQINPFCILNLLV